MPWGFLWIFDQIFIIKLQKNGNYITILKPRMLLCCKNVNIWVEGSNFYVLFIEKSGQYLSEDSIRVRILLKFLISDEDFNRVGTLFKTGLYWRLYGICKCVISIIWIPCNYSRKLVWQTDSPLFYVLIMKMI